MGGILFPAGTAPERRIGRRVPIAGRTVTWAPVAAKRRLRRGASGPAEAQLLDLSHSGARLAVTDAEPLILGARVEIGLGEACGTGVVRRAQRKGAHGTVYGIQFVDLDPAMREAIAAVLAVEAVTAGG